MAADQVRALRRAERLLTRIDRMPGPDCAKAMGSAEAQAAIELIAKARSRSR